MSATSEWNADSYHQVSGPQTEWGRRVLSRLSVRGDERVVDAGCGTGRLTRELAARLPRGRLVAIDRSWNMLVKAREHLTPHCGGRVSLAKVELPWLPFSDWADLVFSTATFHWVLDHQALFAHILRTLRPGGRLFAQCGGGPNLEKAHALAEEVMGREPFARYFASWSPIWEFATPETTASRLSEAGFSGISTSLEPAATTFSEEGTYREFVTTVIYNPHLAMLPEQRLRAQFIDDVTVQAARARPAYTLDYWRLNIEAHRP